MVRIYLNARGLQWYCIGIERVVSNNLLYMVYILGYLTAWHIKLRCVLSFTHNWVFMYRWVKSLNRIFKSIICISFCIKFTDVRRYLNWNTHIYTCITSLQMWDDIWTDIHIYTHASLVYRCETIFELTYTYIHMHH